MNFIWLADLSARYKLNPTFVCILKTTSNVLHEFTLQIPFILVNRKFMLEKADAKQNRVLKYNLYSRPFHGTHMAFNIGKPQSELDLPQII